VSATTRAESIATDIDPQETREWFEALDSVVRPAHGNNRDLTL
jgi:pyruvate dehydrogenase complex dehydrogenase (E1) component